MKVRRQLSNRFTFTRNRRLSHEKGLKHQNAILIFCFIHLLFQLLEALREDVAKLRPADVMMESSVPESDMSWFDKDTKKFLLQVCHNNEQ